MIRGGIIFSSAVLAAAVCCAQNTAAVQQPVSQSAATSPTLAVFNASQITDPSPVNRTINSAAKMPVAPHLAFNIVSNIEVHDLHLRPLFITAIHVPDAVSSISVGDKTLFDVEYKEAEPNIIIVKPATHHATESNLFIAMVSGRTISVRLISPGDTGSATPVDFVVD